MHTLEEEPKILGVNSGRDAMSQVRDPRLCPFTAFETLTHSLNLPLDRFPPAVQYIGIHVALERDTWTGGLPSNARFDTPVQPDHVVSAGLSDMFQRAIRSLGKESEGDNREALGL